MSFREDRYANYTLHPSRATTTEEAVETGSPGAGVYTRVMMARAERGGAIAPAGKPI